MNTDHARPHGSQRTPSSMAPTSRAKTTGILPPKAGTLPLPSRRRGSSSSDGRDGDGGGGGGSDDLRWANPAPRGRQGHAKGSSGAYGYPGSTDNRSGGSVLSRRQSGDSYGQMPHDGGGQQRSSSRAGGAPIYRSGSPAPVRGRKTANNAAGAAKSADPSRFLYRQRARGSENTPSRIPPSFRGYIADSARRGATARRSHVPSPKTRDRGQRASGGDTAGRYPVPRASLVADRSPGQRPSTSEGLTGGNGAGRRGRSASPAPRPSSGEIKKKRNLPSHLPQVEPMIARYTCPVGKLLLPVPQQGSIKLLTGRDSCASCNNRPHGAHNDNTRMVPGEHCLASGRGRVRPNGSVDP